MNHQKEKENNPIYSCIKKNKIPRNNLTKEVKDLYTENCKTLMKLNMTQRNGMMGLPWWCSG